MPQFSLRPQRGSRNREVENPGTYYSAAVLQHLIGAKLETIMGNENITHHSFSTADGPSSRSGDFVINDVAIHATISPSESLIEKCEMNLRSSLRPIIVTTKHGLPLGEGLASNKGLADRIEVFEIEQFMALNIHEFSRFVAAQLKPTVTDLIQKYNEIIDAVETDPSIKIAIE